LAVIAASCSGGAAAQGQTGDIVVTAKDTDEVIREFVQALAPARPLGQLSRFETRPVCPRTVGFVPSQSAAVIARMRRVAAHAGVPVGNADCLGNVLVVVTADKKAFLSALEKKHSYYFDGVPAARVAKLVSAPAPVAAWQIGGPRLNGDGVEMPVDMYGTAFNRTTRTSSRLQAPARPQFQAAMVVIEAAAITGLTTTQIADYASMRAYADVDPSKLGPSPPPTILTVIDAAPDAAVPVTLTTWDFGFLRGLYAAPRNLNAAAERAEIGRSLKKDVVHAQRD
jgi:hypothetical protein